MPTGKIFTHSINHRHAPPTVPTNKPGPPPPKVTRAPGQRDGLLNIFPIITAGFAMTVIKVKEEQHMKTLSIALMAAFMLVLAATSYGQDQSAETIYNYPNPGGRSVYRGCTLAEVIYIRGDKLSEINELTLIIETQGSYPVRLTFPILAKRQEGNKIIVDYQWPSRWRQIRSNRHRGYSYKPEN